ncbi:cation:proton antiporter [Companilactobacillus nodensis]|uniref:Na+ H+ antiporter n=1 Tax=Companilactobacillus nodensis DSM 19682 = JCM 14932 = NBRC 107160 TaxID=1423775 RepID=A0A0R1KCR7_9LACO|nr:cation:proton antiporter [Companilactobacillus nodensis]KRK81317.1 Na+ H+ antiporter [Companilactobacillus nodensis DSM 19682 = JCM 14932 = NBRC 107160]
MVFLGILVLILITTTIVGHYSSRIGVPAVIGQLLVGIILGPAILNWVKPTEFIHVFSEMGVIILMFIAGIESDMQLLKKYLKPSFLVAILGVIVPVVLTYGVGTMFHMNATESLFLSVIFAATSVSISVAVLKELDVLNGKAGATILGAAVVDDILAVIILSVMVSLLGGGKNSSGGPSLLITFAEQIIYFVAIYFVVKFVAPYMAKIGEKLFIPVGPTIMAMILCFGMAYIADLIGLSSVVGAFFAGIAISQTKVRDEVDRSIEPIGYAIFIPVFFVSIGLNMTLNGIEHDLWFIVVLTLVAIISKLFGAGLGARVSKFSMNESYMVGAGMVSRGEMALIIAQIGYQSKLISSDYYSAIIAAVILTTLIAPFLLKHAAKSAPQDLN